MRRGRARKPLWGVHNLVTPHGVEALQRRAPNQQDEYQAVDPQPKILVPIIDEADPHANQRDSFSGQYGVLYCLREDDVRDKDIFWYQPHVFRGGVWVPSGQRFKWGIVGADRWNIEHVRTKVDYGVKQFRIRRGG